VEDDLIKTAENLKHFFFDIKAEAIVSDLMHNGLDIKDLIIFNKGAQKRPHSRDLQNVAIEDFKKNRDYLLFFLNRDSIYDGLPQSIFHRSRPDDSSGISVKQMKEAYRQRKREEKNARSFFSPFENEFFLQKTLVETTESQLLFDMENNLFDNDLLSFLGIDASLPKEIISKLCCILPYKDQIAGNIPLSIKCLKYILNEKINYRNIFPVENQPFDNLSLGKSTLGTDMLLGNSYHQNYRDLEVCIGPVKKSDLLSYLEGGIHHKFLKLFYNFFIPLTMEVHTLILVEKKTSQFVLAKNKEDGILGYTTTL
jgi:hypothetical protein